MPYNGKYICDILNILKVKNFGISFGLFSENPTISFYFIIFFDIIVILYLFYCFHCKNNYTKSLLYQTCLSFIIGGAFGNCIDRITTGSVRDFLDFHIGIHHWPCFNIADIFICVGVGVWILCELFFRKPDIKK